MGRQWMSVGDRDQVLSLHRAGGSVRQIAAKTGRSKSSVGSVITGQCRRSKDTIRHIVETAAGATGSIDLDSLRRITERHRRQSLTKSQIIAEVKRSANLSLDGRDRVRLSVAL